MPQYVYRAKDVALKIVEGTIEADSETAAITRLGSQGVFPLSITEVSRVGASRQTGGAVSPRRQRVSARALAQMTRQLADLLGGGLPLMSALTLLAKQTDQPALRRVVEALTTAVREGHALSDALLEHPAVFPPLYVSMVRAGEVGGALEQSLARLADLGENEAELRSRLLSASAYPLFVLLAAAAMTVFLMSYVIPALSQVFIDSGQLLPLPTRILLSISGFFTHWWWVAAAGLVAAIWLLGQWRRSPSGKATIDRVALVLPGIGGLVRKLETARFVRGLGVMVGQGVPMLQAMDVVGRSVSNTALRRAVRHIQEAVQDGANIASALNATGEFPAFVGNMITVGEESGTVDTALLKVAATYEREIDRTIRTLTTILEPVLLVVVGGVVMFIVLAMLLPIFQMGLVVQ